MIVVVVLKRKVLHVSLTLMNLVIHDIFFREGFGKNRNLLSFCRLQEIVFILPHCSMAWPSTYKLRFE